MACLVEGDGALLGGRHDLGLLLQTANDAINGVEEVLLGDGLGIAAGSNEGCLVADIGDVGTGETGRLTGKEVDVEAGVYLDGLQVYLEDLLALGEVGEVDVDLTVETSGT